MTNAGPGPSVENVLIQNDNRCGFNPRVGLSSFIGCFHEFEIAKFSAAFVGTSPIRIEADCEKCDILSERNQTVFPRKSGILADQTVPCYVAHGRLAT